MYTQEQIKCLIERVDATIDELNKFRFVLNSDSNEYKKEILLRRVDHSSMPTRVVNILKEIGIVYNYQLVCKSEGEMRRHRGCSVGAVSSLTTYLSSLGLGFGTSVKVVKEILGEDFKF